MDLQILAKFHVLRVERHDTCSLNRGLDGRVSANFDCVLCSHINLHPCQYTPGSDLSTSIDCL